MKKCSILTAVPFDAKSDKDKLFDHKRANAMDALRIDDRNEYLMIDSKRACDCFLKQNSIGQTPKFVYSCL